MSTENVQIIRRLVEAFNDRDFDSMAEHIQPDAELHPLRAQLEGKAYRGHEGLREMLADFDQDWEYVRMEPEEYRDADDEVVVLGRLHGRGGPVVSSSTCRWDLSGHSATARSCAQRRSPSRRTRSGLRASSSSPAQAGVAT